MNMKNVKIEIFNALVEALAKIEAQAAEIAELKAQIAATKVEATPTVVKRDMSVFISAANKQRTEFAAARTEFVVSWCAANAQTSCPSDVVNDWASARK